MMVKRGLRLGVSAIGGAGFAIGVVKSVGKDGRGVEGVWERVMESWEQ